MEHCQPIQRSCPPHQLLDESSAHSRTRQPLREAPGNALAPSDALSSIGLLSHDSKATQPPVDRPYSIVPSQPSRQSLGSTLELRKQSIRRQRRNRLGSQNPIVNSPQYIAYRNRQSREGNEHDLKWPAVLEDAFLDALLLIPRMGRRKFSMKGKPYGRNELISEYLWIAYCQSLAPGEVPDNNMKRARKQVSSHIQVLKGFMKGHPAAERLFSKTTPANGFEDSFKNDPVLRALQDGHIFNPYSGDDPSGHGNRTAMQSHTSIKPVVFWLLITKSSVPDDVCGRYTTEEDLYRNRAIVHKYTGLHSHSQQDRENLEDLPNWRERFPYMARSLSLNELNCEIIHMDVSLELTRESAPSGAELVTRVEIIIPGPALGKHRWQTVTSLFKPQELYYTDLNHDPPLDRKKFIADALDVNENQTRIKVPFPANTWAHALSNLTNLQYAYDDGRRAQQLDGGSHGSTRPVREYVDQISMYQEVQSAANCQECTEREVMNGYRTPRCNCGGKGEQFVTRAIILWTFNKARRGDQGSTTWRYIDPHPPRRMLMSPSPHPSHHIAASMSEHFNSWAETPMHLQNHSMLDPFVQGLATPPNTAGLQSPFVAGYGYTPNHFDVHHENISFASHATTVDSESTLVENETNANIDSFLSNTNVNLGDFDHNSNSWHMPQTESFDADPAWANYNVPASTPHIGWDNDAKNHVWPEGSPTKQVIWIEDGSGKHEQLWNDVIPIPVKQDGNFIGTSLEQKLLPWIDQHADVDGEVGRNGFHGDSNNTQLPDLDNGVNRGTSAKEQVWNGGDEGFEYEQLAERMK